MTVKKKSCNGYAVNPPSMPAEVEMTGMHDFSPFLSLRSLGSNATRRDAGEMQHFGFNEWDIQDPSAVTTIQ